MISIPEIRTRVRALNESFTGGDPTAVRCAVSWFEAQEIPLAFSSARGFFVAQETLRAYADWREVEERVEQINALLSEAPHARHPRKEELLRTIAALVSWLADHAPGVCYQSAKGGYILPPEAHAHGTMRLVQRT